MYIEPLLDFNVWLLVKNVCWLLVRDFYTKVPVWLGAPIFRCTSRSLSVPPNPC